MNTADQNNTERIFRDIVNSVNTKNPSKMTINPVKYDKNYRDENDNQHIITRNNQYTEILKKYTDFLDKALDFKSSQREKVIIFFEVVLGVVITALIFFIGYIILNKDFDTNVLIAFVTASGTFISALLIIPTKIAEFIFNRDEEKYILDIIKNIQDYDKNVRNGFDEKLKNIENNY